MTNNAVIDAFAAGAYIVGIVFFINNFIARPNTPDDPTILIPIMMLSLFVLSAAIMGFLFLYRPLVLWFEGKREEAMRFFLTTTAVFACITGTLFAAFILLFR